MMKYLESSLAEEYKQVETFLETTTQRLDKQPTQADELREAWDEFDKLQEDTKETQKIYLSLKDKLNLIKSLGRVQTKSSQILESWEKFEIRVKNYKNELRTKQSNMKTEMDKQIKDFENQISKFESK